MKSDQLQQCIYGSPSCQASTKFKFEQVQLIKSQGGMWVVDEGGGALNAAMWSLLSCPLRLHASVSTYSCTFSTIYHGLLTFYMERISLHKKFIHSRTDNVLPDSPKYCVHTSALHCSFQLRARPPQQRVNDCIFILINGHHLTLFPSCSEMYNS